jgi:hypothetical protein
MVEKGLLSVLLWSGAVPERIQGTFFLLGASALVQESNLLRILIDICMKNCCPCL